jgi:hypothetical protein
MELHELLEQVKDPESFLEFAKALLEDRIADIREAQPDLSDRTARGWVNTSVENFLESAIAWAEDTKFGRSADANPWKDFATFLFCGKTYE